MAVRMMLSSYVRVGDITVPQIRFPLALSLSGVVLHIDADGLANGTLVATFAPGIWYLVRNRDGRLSWAAASSPEQAVVELHKLFDWPWLRPEVIPSFCVLVSPVNPKKSQEPTEITVASPS